jgi:hypothetical protein
VARQHLAKTIGSNTVHLADLWVTAVRQDPRIRSDDNLTPGEVRDEVPAIIGEIADVLLGDAPPLTTTAHEGRAHVYTRYRQGYRPRDLIRELSLLRLVLLDFVAAMSDGGEVEVSFSDYAETSRVVNLYLDEEMRYAITVYTESAGPPD